MLDPVESVVVYSETLAELPLCATWSVEVEDDERLEVGNTEELELLTILEPSPKVPARAMTTLNDVTRINNAVLRKACPFPILHRSNLVCQIEINRIGTSAPSSSTLANSDSIGTSQYPNFRCNGISKILDLYITSPIVVSLSTGSIRRVTVSSRRQYSESNLGRTSPQRTGAFTAGAPRFQKSLAQLAN